ncbi:uncharacterized protein LOC123327255 [Drosophila simulans]|uniref:uncharacterized protein LOC123327255 n=1 Tax=Drosophila simulans TaxID=7240 RepID=UPI001D127C9C|nr:uncharacterized protein LOC123327255 [Drosophila simulans]
MVIWVSPDQQRRRWRLSSNGRKYRDSSGEHPSRQGGLGCAGKDVHQTTSWASPGTEPWYNQGCTLRTPRISHAGLCTDRGRSQAMWEQPRRLWWHRYTLPVTRRAHRPKSLHWQNTARGHTHPSSSDVMQMHMGQQRSESKRRELLAVEISALSLLSKNSSDTKATSRASPKK